MSSSRAVSLLKRSSGLSKIFVRNAGGGPAVEHHPQLPPFPPGPRQMEQAKNWLGSAVVFGAAAFVGLCYFSDWKVVVGFIPFYNGKFPPEEPAKKK